MDYTIDDLKGKYVKVGTHEAEIFLDACEELGILRYEGQQAKDFKPSLKVVRVCGVDGTLKQSGYADGEPFTTKPQWSIYTNDKPLSDLSDEKAAALFNWWRGGGETEFKLAGDNPWNSNYPISFLTWGSNVIYRAKQKSERELFVEAAVSVYDGRTGLSESAMSLAAEMMFKSGKFKLVEDNNK